MNRRLTVSSPLSTAITMSVCLGSRERSTTRMSPSYSPRPASSPRPGGHRTWRRVLDQQLMQVEVAVQVIVGRRGNPAATSARTAVASGLKARQERCRGPRHCSWRGGYINKMLMCNNKIQMLSTHLFRWHWFHDLRVVVLRISRRISNAPFFHLFRRIRLEHLRNPPHVNKVWIEPFFFTSFLK